MQERERQRRSLDRVDSPTGSAIAPGKLATSARYIARKSRDDDGVSADADAAVDRAASSSGAVLPAELRARFESSLGSDLSDVRIHTGAASADAAAAVGAKAYAVGQDVHFGAGHYDPASSDGQFLIAHEVAHTVQQRGGAARAQYKLEVSTPGDAAELEADRAATAMIAGSAASVGASSGGLHRDADSDVDLSEDHVTPGSVTTSSSMRAEQEKAAGKLRQLPPTRSAGATTRVDQNQAQTYVSHIDEAQGDLGMLAGREDAANKEGQDGVGFGETFTKFTEGSGALAHNKDVREQLMQFSRSAARQGFQHTFFADSYKTLSEDFVKLKANIEVLKQQGAIVSGDQAKSDIEAMKKSNPLLGPAIEALDTAMTDLDNTANNAGAGLSAIASEAGADFAELGNATEAMQLPMPKLDDTKEQEEANTQVKAINDDLAAAKATIGQVKEVVETALAVATGGVSAEAKAGMQPVKEMLANLGKKADEISEKIPDGGAHKLESVKGMAKKGESAAVESVEDALAHWMTSYDTKISAANGKVSALSAAVKAKVQSIQTDHVRSLQSKLAAAIGKFALLRNQVQEKKAAVENAAKKVQEQASAKGAHGTDAGAAAQAMSAVSAFLSEADATESLGAQEAKQGDAAQSKMKEMAGTYGQVNQPGELGGAGGVAQTFGGDRVYYSCKRASDADTRGTYDFSGYDVQANKLVFTVNEDDVDERSVVMHDRTADQLKNVAKWKIDAVEFKAELASSLGIGPSTIK